MPNVPWEEKAPGLRTEWQRGFWEPWSHCRVFHRAAIIQCESCEPFAISPLPLGGLSSGVLHWGVGVSTGTEIQYATDTSVFCLFNYSPMRQMLLLSLHWSREFALRHTRGGSLAQPVRPPVVSCVEVQEGKEPDTRKLFPEATCSSGPLESYGFSDHHLKINSVVLLRA